LLSAITWAATGLFIRAQGSGLSPITISALRSSVAGLVLVAIWLLVGDAQPIPFIAVLLLIASLLAGLGLGDTLYFAAIGRIGVARALPISMAYPVLTAVLAVVLLGEHLGPVSALGIVATLAGVYLVAAPTRGVSHAQASAPGTYWGGVAMAVAAAVGWSISAVTIRPALEYVDVWTASAVRMPLASALLWLVAARAGALPTRAHLRKAPLLMIGAAGLLNVLATVFFLVGVASAGAARTAVLTATAPIWVVPASVLLFGERATWRLGVGALCTMAGVVILTLSHGG